MKIFKLGIKSPSLLGIILLTFLFITSCASESEKKYNSLIDNAEIHVSKNEFALAE